MYLIASKTFFWVWEKFAQIELQCSLSPLEWDLREFQIIKAFTFQKQGTVNIFQVWLVCAGLSVGYIKQ